jgi:type III restriction enzyme
MKAPNKISKIQRDLFNVQDLLSTAPCVPAIREAVKTWRIGGYKNTTDTTKELLNYWFFTDHILRTGIRFQYHQAQREAIETLIYLFEIEKVRTRKDLLEKFAFNTRDLRLPPYDLFARYCIKMATGSGKTKVMSLAVVWQYFNAVREDDAQYAKTFLIIAPNVIVFDRLRTDFENGRIFKTDPLFPKHYDLFWDLEFYMRGEAERAHSLGALYLTNIQQFYERESRQKIEEPEVMTAVLGSKPPTSKMDLTDFDQRIADRDGLLLVLNDEAHHTHDEDNEWNKIIRRIHQQRPLSAQLDFSATPRYSKGTLFAWTVLDYPLKQAILDRIVKRPIKGISKIEESKSTISSVRYKGFLTAGVERWKEYHKQLAPLGKKPTLFIMMNDTDEADEVGDWLKSKYPETFGGKKTLIIHTDKSGEVSKKDLADARNLARAVDEDESPVNAIVSVLMLREGWDVQNVTVVVGLRPYSSKANILPEQTIGRGLRLMFRNLSSDYTERVDIIGNRAFLEFVEDLEKIEGFKLETFEIGKDLLKIITIAPVDDKMYMDIGIPELSALLERKKSLAQEIAELDVTRFKINPLPLKTKDIDEIHTFIYEGRDILTDEKLLEREYAVPPAQTSEEVIGYYARRIAHDIKLPSQFASLAPKIQDFFKTKAFDREVNLNEELTIRAISSNLASYVVVKEFEKALRQLIVEEKEPILLNAERLLSSTPPFPFSKVLFKAAKTIFNYVACDNEYEKRFAKFLENSEDVTSFAKFPEQFGFFIHYQDKLANLRNYYPDFIVRLSNGDYWIIETKGREDTDVILKDASAINWCSNASRLTNKKWDYLKVLQQEFESFNPSNFSELLVALNVKH